MTRNFWARRWECKSKTYAYFIALLFVEFWIQDSVWKQGFIPWQNMRHVQSSKADSTGGLAATSRVGLLERRRDSQFPARFARQGTSLWRRTMPHTAQLHQPLQPSSGLKVQVVPGGRRAGSRHEILSLEDGKATRWSCGEARYAAPRTFPLARVTVGACREHTPILTVTVPTFISNAKPFNSGGLMHK